jgi:hypothetical protein
MDDAVNGRGIALAMVDENRTLREVMSEFATANDFVTETGGNAGYWYLGRGILHIRLPNFAWRERAIARHDAHHLLTGYPCTPAGEMQMAAWEFAAGRFPHPGATAFCLPLVGLGAFAFPRRTFAAFVRGRRSTSLYATTFSDEMLASRMTDLRLQFAPTAPSQISAKDWLAYVGLVGLSLAQILAPIALLTLAAVAGSR